MRGSGRFARGLLAAVLALALGANAAFADRLILKSGRTIEGRILEEDNARIEIEVAGSRLTIPRAQIQSIERSDAAANALLDGDRLLENGKYAEALAAYNRARASNASEADAKLAATVAALESALPRLTPAEAELQLRAAPAAAPLPAAAILRLNDHLAALLVRMAAEKPTPAQKLPLLEESWRLAPATPGAGLALARALEQRDRNDRRVNDTLKTYLEHQPNDTDAIHLYVERIWRFDAAAALRALYPQGRLHPQLNKQIRALVPSILLACHQTSPYPPHAPFNRQTCYRHYLALKAETESVGRSVAPTPTPAVTPAPKVPADYLQALLEMQKKDPRPNAMIHYQRAGNYLPPTPGQEQTQAVQKVLTDGWTPEAAALQSYFQALQPGFAEIRKGAALGSARNLGMTYGVNTPVPNFLSAQRLAKAMCAEGRFLESQGRFNEALENYLAVLTMGRDYGAPNAILISALISMSLQQIAVNQVHRLITTGRLEAPALTHSLARLRTIESTRLSIAAAFREEGRSQEMLYDEVPRNPQAFRMFEEIAQMGGRAIPAQYRSMSSDQLKQTIDQLTADNKAIYDLLARQAETPIYQWDEAAMQRETDAVLAKAHPLARMAVPNVREAAIRFYVVQARLRLAEVAAALALHKARTGSYPDQLAALTPAPLETLPVDPFSGQALRYRATPGGRQYTLHSLGPDRLDNSGSIAYDSTNGTVSAGDIFVK